MENMRKQPSTPKHQGHCMPSTDWKPNTPPPPVCSYALKSFKDSKVFLHINMDLTDPWDVFCLLFGSLVLFFGDVVHRFCEVFFSILQSWPWNTLCSFWRWGWFWMFHGVHWNDWIQTTLNLGRPPKAQNLQGFSVSFFNTPTQCP